MRPRQHLPPALARLAADQAGVLSTRQLRDGGLTRNVISRLAREWQQPASGLYVLRDPTFESAAWAGLLRGGDDAVIGAEAAGHLHEIVRRAPSELVIWTPARRESFQFDKWRITYKRAHRRGMLTLRRTSIEATLLDIADRTSEDELVAAVARALANKKTAPDRIMAALAERNRVGHRDVVTQLCARACQGIESALEWRFHTKVLLPHGLPIPERQVRRGAGRVDGHYRDYGLIIELDGLADHVEATKDMRRDNHNLVQDDSRTLRFGWANVNDEPCVVMRQVATLLWRGGWTSSVLQCGNCLAAA